MGVFGLFLQYANRLAIPERRGYVRKTRRRGGGEDGEEEASKLPSLCQTSMLAGCVSVI